MQSPTDPADRTGTIGVEAFDATYGAGFQASDDSPHAVECELVEDGGAFVAHRPTNADRRPHRTGRRGKSEHRVPERHSRQICAKARPSAEQRVGTVGRRGQQQTMSRCRSSRS